MALARRWGGILLFSYLEMFAYGVTFQIDDEATLALF